MMICEPRTHTGPSLTLGMTAGCHPERSEGTGAAGGAESMMICAPHTHTGPSLTLGMTEERNHDSQLP